MIADGATIHMAEISDDDLVAAATDAEHLRLLREVGPRRRC